MSEATTATPRWQQRAMIETSAYAMVILACAWWLLGQWGNVLRPLLLAIFLAYVLLPWYSRLRRWGVPAPVVIVVLGGFVALSLFGIVEIAYASATELRGELPLLEHRLNDLVQGALGWLKHKAPGLPLPNSTNGLSDGLNQAVTWAVSWTGNGLIEAGATALYLLFLLLGAERLPGRVRLAWPGEDGERILRVAGKINSSIISYLRAKVISSSLLAIGSGIVLAGFGIKFLAIWILLTFLCNFIPYLGSAISYTLPTAYAALQLPPWGEPIAVALLLLGVQVASATLIEPMLIGRAVGLSPLLILAALAVWGTIWGLPGMFLAVPLTVVLKIVLQHIDATRPLANLAEE